ncbi:Bardet-Biedl syndrome 1 protein isoform X1 [Bombyx mori]|uniref:Bardet-Biedl syndrome 1 n=2 Tax=Bombyx mori TaxID=7091 RepID=A0A8R2HR77_BOMMO|nr:Bardet-Biedl syndrome 1 protein isoform X1 [Bombyx mori]
MTSMSRWLDVEVGTDDIDLNTLPSNLALVDLQNDKDYKLLVADFGKGEEGPKLKVFKGTMQTSDILLPELPLGIVGFYTSEAIPRSMPIIAVAFSSAVYLYRNMKFFYKYLLPSVDLSVHEMDVWKQLINSENQTPEMITILQENLKAIPPKILSLQSQNFLALTLDQQLEYLEQAAELPMWKPPEITCISTLKMNSIDQYSVSCLVVGTEDGYIIILDPQTFTTLSQAKLCPMKKTPYRMITTGLYNVDYRITVASREKSVCLLKRESTEGRILFNTEEHIISIEVITADESIIVICTDNTMSCYTKKGKKQWCVNLEHRPISMTLVPVLHLGVTLVGVALTSGHVHFYEGKARLDTLFVRDVASVMRFGRLGQEEHVLIVVTGSGNLMLKILKRTADFNSSAAGVEPAPSAAAGHKPWLIPKKSKLFLEQSARERENAVPMHEAFQLELNRLRLLATRTLLDAHAKSENFMGVGAMEPIGLTAEVEGLGPVFRVTLFVENKSKERAVAGLAVLFHAHTAHYRVTNPYIKVPLISPGGKLKFPTKIEEVFEENINPDVFFRPVTGQAGDRALVKVLLLKEDRKRPVLAATVQMPPTDPMMLPFEKIQSGYQNNAVDWEIERKN